MITFGEWLAAQHVHRRPAVRDLARDWAADEDRPVDATLDDVHARLYDMDAVAAAHGVADDAHRDYLAHAQENTTATACRHCGDPLKYDDDRADGYHTSVGKCVRAEQAVS